jgi:hypothetical protein
MTEASNTSDNISAVHESIRGPLTGGKLVPTARDLVDVQRAYEADPADNNSVATLRRGPGELRSSGTVTGRLVGPDGLAITPPAEFTKELEDALRAANDPNRQFTSTLGGATTGNTTNKSIGQGVTPG